MCINKKPCIIIIIIIVIVLITIIIRNNNNNDNNNNMYEHMTYAIRVCACCPMSIVWHIAIGC